MAQSPDLAILHAVPVPLVLIGPGGQVAVMNAGARALFGKGGEGRNHVAALRHPALVDCIAAALSDGAAQTADFTARLGDQDTSFRATASPLDGGQGVVLTLEDIGHVRAADEMRRDFVANVSHELRTPLTALSGFIETLQGPARDDPAARERFLGIMAGEARRMARLIGDLLALGRVEADARLRPGGAVDLGALLKRVCAALAPLASERGADLHLAAGAAPVRLAGDADQLAQVFTNLIENALKYGGGQVSVTLGPVARDVELRARAVRVTVTDNGAGIDPLHLPRLTERFYRVDTHRSRELGGTGLGLAIVKHIVARHRGRMRIESETGVESGTRVSVILPVQESPVRDSQRQTSSNRP